MHVYKVIAIPNPQVVSMDLPHPLPAVALSGHRVFLSSNPPCDTSMIPLVGRKSIWDRCVYFGPSPPSCALEPHHARPFRALDAVLDVDPPVQLVHLPPYPRHLVLEVDLVAQDFSGLGMDAERVQGTADDAGR